MLIIHVFQHEDDKKIEKEKKIFRVFFFLLQCMNINLKSKFWLAQEAESYRKKQSNEKKSFYAKYNKK